VDDAGLGKNRWGAYGPAHRGSLEGGGFGGVAARTGFSAIGYRRASEQQDLNRAQPVHGGIIAKPSPPGTKMAGGAFAPPAI
jgi:hypothetical protein